MTAGITAEVASNASNLLMNIKPGYMLGAKPRLQAIGHVLGIMAGAVVAAPVFYYVFLSKGPSQLVSDQYPMPAATIWRAVAELLMQGLGNLPMSARWAVLDRGPARTGSSKGCDWPPRAAFGSPAWASGWPR